MGHRFVGLDSLKLVADGDEEDLQLDGGDEEKDSGVVDDCAPLACTLGGDGAAVAAA